MDPLNCRCSSLCNNAASSWATSGSDYLGEVDPRGLKQFGLRGPTTVLELDLRVSRCCGRLVPQQQPLSEYPAIARDLNLIVGEHVSWASLEATIRQAAGSLLESLEFQEVYRDPKKDGAGKKRLLFSLTCAPRNAR